MRHRWISFNKISFWSSQWALQNDTLVTYSTATVQKLLSCEVSTFDEVRNRILSSLLDPESLIGFCRASPPDEFRCSEPSAFTSEDYFPDFGKNLNDFFENLRASFIKFMIEWVEQAPRWASQRICNRGTVFAWQRSIISFTYHTVKQFHFEGRIHHSHYLEIAYITMIWLCNPRYNLLSGSRYGP